MVGGETTDPDARSARRRPRLSAVAVDARGERFNIVQLKGNLFVCSREHGSCCCGWEEKGRLPFSPSIWGDEWERRKIRNQLHLTFTGCLGPCAVGNNALLQIHGRSLWFKDLNDPQLVPTVFDYVEAMLLAGRVLLPPRALDEHLYERYVAPPSQDTVPVLPTVVAEDALDRLDPVCLMEVDPETARHTVVYDGHRIGFCAPSCKREFQADPAAYLSS